MLSSYSQETLDALAEEAPLGVLGQPEDIAAAACFLAGDGGKFVTGQVLGVNGGLVIT
jgi:3-oxoacyl-[acyl-carrier protein] reductase